MGTSNIIVYVPPTLFLIVSISFFLLWRLAIITSWQWSAGFAQTAIGFVLSTFSIEPSFNAFSSGLVFIGASYCYGSGLLSHFGAPRLRFARLTFVAAYIVCLAYLVFIAQSLIWQLFLTDAGFALLLLIAVVVCAKRASRPVDIALILASVVVVLDSVLRTTFFTFFTSSSDDLGDFANSAYNLAVHVTTITVCMVFPFTALGAIASAAIDRHREDAERDPLTGLLNRRGFDKAISADLIAATPQAVGLICDIDHFKTINDRYGHAVGDKVIAAFARDMERVVDGKGYVARAGGEEFVAFLPHTSIDQGLGIAEAIRNAFGHRDWTGLGINKTITVSCGVSERLPQDASHDAVFLRADQALYNAKSSGRNRVLSAVATMRQGKGVASPVTLAEPDFTRAG